MNIWTTKITTCHDSTQSSRNYCLHTLLISWSYSEVLSIQSLEIHEKCTLCTRTGTYHKKNTVIKVIRREKKPCNVVEEKTTSKNINMQITNIIKSCFVHCIHLTNEIRAHQGSWTNQTQYRILQTGFLKIFWSLFICRFSMFAKHNKERGVWIMKHKLSKFLKKQFLWNCWFWGNGCFSLMLFLFVNFKHKLIAKSQMFYKGLDSLHKRTYFFKR